MKTNIIRSIITFLVASIFGFSGKSYCQETPIYFKDYNLKITSVSLGDTITSYNRSGEKFRFVFYDRKGKCYCEKYSYGKLSEIGFFTTSENPSQVLLSARNSEGQTKATKREEWFEPVKNGKWHIYENDVEIKIENYVMGVLQK